jgi:GMP reductase
MKYLSYQDVLLVANYSELETRDNADASVELCGFKFKLPIVPSNMLDVINPLLAKYLSNNGYFYIYHRFGKGFDVNLTDNLNTVYFVKIANKEKWSLISISTGINQDSLKELMTIKALRLRVDFITIDVAHAHHIKVKQQIKWIRENLPNTKIIAGNVMTSQACIDLKEWGADVLKIGVGQGSICTTRFQTGFSMPMFSCIQECNCCDFNVLPIIADGGIQTIGDISKALVAGAKMVMSGKLFASCIDSPAQILDGKKQYRGSTSFAVKKHNKHIEGKTIDLEADITFAERLQEIKEAIQSSISYAGGKNLDSFKKVKWIEIT